MKSFQMQYIEEFKRLREYAAELVESNPGTNVQLEVETETDNAQGTFKR